MGLCACGQQKIHADDLVRVLADEGFEDIRVKVVGDTLFASFEDLAHRGTFRGAAVAIEKMATEQPDLQSFHLVLTDYKMPQLIVRASKCGATWDVSVDRNMTRALEQLQAEKPVAASTGKLDIVVYPRVYLINNKLDHLFDYSIRIAPALAMNLWKGGRLTLQPIFPVLYRLDDYNSKRFIQIGTANLTQQLISNQRWQLTASVGFFDVERAGVHARVGYHAFRNLDFYIDAGLTGQANYDKVNGFGLSNWNRLDVMARADYYEPHTRLQLELQGGRFVYGDWGTRADVTRHFGEYAVGVYGILADGEWNAGFHFAIPMGGKRQKRKGFVRLRLPEYFAWEYSMSSYNRFWEEQMGELYDTQPDQNRSAHFWQPEYVEEYVRRMLNGTFH